MLLTTVGAFAAFSLMTIAIGTDYWLYSSANLCNGTNVTATDETAQSQPKKVKGDLTHSGLWRFCCIEVTLAHDKLLVEFIMVKSFRQYRADYGVNLAPCQWVCVSLPLTADLSPKHDKIPERDPAGELIKQIMLFQGKQMEGSISKVIRLIILDSTE
ncbi:hypothetical protein E2320_016004 [Naja naja]|nr:hypothetical protein E2320_016004 [Naja naja]